MYCTMASCRRPFLDQFVPKIVALVVCIIKMDAMHDDSCRRLKSDRSLDQRFGALVALNIKMDVRHSDFMSTPQICHHLDQGMVSFVVLNIK